MRANSKSVWECFLLNTLGRIGQIVAKSKSKLKWQSGLKKSDRILRSEKKKADQEIVRLLDSHEVLRGCENSKERPETKVRIR